MPNLDHVKLTPGDFAAALRKLHILGEPLEPRRVLDALRLELAAKPGAGRGPMGFVAPAGAPDRYN